MQNKLLSLEKNSFSNDDNSVKKEKYCIKNCKTGDINAISNSVLETEKVIKTLTDTFCEDGLLTDIL